MRKLIAKTDMSLDGVIDNPGAFTAPYWTDEWNEHAGALTFDTLLMGRKTYEGFSAAWTRPEMLEAEGEFATHMNTVPKYVVSSTLDSAEWNNTTVVRPEDLEAEVTRIKQAPGGDIVMFGFGGVAHHLLKAGLLDELQVWIYPVLAGAVEVDKLLFRDGTQIPLRLNKASTLKSGVIILSFGPAEPS